MICPKCGIEVAEGLTACPACGELMATEPAAPVAAPVAQPVAPAAPERKVGKMNYLLTKAPAGIRVVAVLVWVLALVTLAVLGLSYQAAVNTGYTELPAFAALPEELTSMTDRYEEALGGAIDQLEGYINEAAELNAEQKAALEQLLESAKTLEGDITLNNINEIVGEFENTLEVDLGDTEMGEILGAFDMASTVSMVMDILMLALLIVVIFCGIWTFFGGVFRINGLIIVGMIFTLLYSLPLCPTVYTVGLLALNIAMIVLTAIANSSYKTYRKN
ncbi:MAG: zinc ribbon domain-containing protein [Clostridia bacterium]|nr:zinc ribbon domain-containing protein [Clostridia bacterium]